MARLRGSDSFGGSLDRENELNGGGGLSFQTPIQGGEHYGEGEQAPGGVVPPGMAVNIQASHAGITPRENASVQMRPPQDNGHANDAEPQGGGGATPARPRTPTPMAGSAMTASSGGDTSGQGLTPFTPLPQTNFAPLATPGAGGGAGAGLFGSLGGLQGGGLGVPLDPTANEQSDPISSLIKNLMASLGRQ